MPSDDHDVTYEYMPCDGTYFNRISPSSEAGMTCGTRNGISHLERYHEMGPLCPVSFSWIVKVFRIVRHPFAFLVLQKKIAVIVVWKKRLK